MRCILLITFLLFAAVPLRGRPIRANVPADALLVALHGVGHGEDSLPGVYALDSDGALCLVVPYGREPRWSPDRRSIALLGGRDHPDAVCRIDVRSSDLEIVETGRTWADLPWLPNEFNCRPRGICWTPSGSDMLLWGRELAVGDMATPVGSMLCPFLVRLETAGQGRLPDPLVDPRASGKVDGVIGRVSFAPQGGFAYEWYGQQAWLSVGKPEVWFHDGGKKPDRKLVLPLPDCAGLVNPLWAPDGKWLAVDRIGEGGRTRTCVVVAADLGNAREAVSATGMAGKLNTAGIAWSPDATKILVKNTEMAHLGLGKIGIVELGGNGELRTFGGLNCDMQACWSPDGGRIAILQGAAIGADPYRVTGGMITIVSVRSEAPGIRHVPLPKGLVPVSIDW